MKKTFLIIMFLSIFACQRYDETLDNTYSLKKENNKRTFNEALAEAEIAKDVFFSGDDATRVPSERKINIKDGVHLIIDTNIGTRLTDDNYDTLMYVFNFYDDQGFVVVSGSKNTCPIIAITEKGNYDSEVSSCIEGFDYIMTAAKVFVSESLKQEPHLYETTRVPILPINYTLLEQKGKFINTMWGQYDIEGADCPNGVAGCANIAMAQLMSYYAHPTSIDINYFKDNSILEIDNYALNWNGMKEHGVRHSDIPLLECIATEPCHTMITRLCRQLGVTSNSEYGNVVSDITGMPTTSTSNTNIHNTFTYYDYSVTQCAYNDSLLKSILNEERPVYMTGNDLGSQVAHAWLVDGYRYYMITSRFGLDNQILTEYKYYNHINWGWYGKNNGYFANDIFSTLSGLTTDFGRDLNRDFIFDYNLLIFNVYPNE